MRASYPIFQTIHLIYIPCNPALHNHIARERLEIAIWSVSLASADLQHFQECPWIMAASRDHTSRALSPCCGRIDMVSAGCPYTLTKLPRPTSGTTPIQTCSYQQPTSQQYPWLLYHDLETATPYIYMQGSFIYSGS